MSDIRPFKASFTNPFELDEDEIRELVGDVTPAEMRCIRAVLNGIRNKLHNTNMMNGFTHSDLCWSWGPAHYPCAYNKVVAMCRERPALTDDEIRGMLVYISQTGDEVHFADVKRVVEIVEAHHHIGGAR